MTARESLIHEITHARFTPVRLREGYDMGQVDDFLDRLAAAVGASQPVDDLVRQARFVPVRLREGYDMAEVDALLRRVVEEARGLPAHDTGSVGGTVADDEPPAVEYRPLRPEGAEPPSVIQEQRGLLGRLFGGR